LVIFGANWCPDAQCLEAVMKLVTVNKFVAQHYEVMRIDVGDYDQNMDLYKVFRMPSKEGIPRVIILDLKGKVLNLDSNDRWRAARETAPQEIFNYFQEFANQP